MGLERKYVLGIFALFSDVYGNLWTSSMPDEATTERKMRTWAQVLAGIDPKEISEVLQRLPEYLPSAPQFRALCKQNAPSAPYHKPFPKALPKPPPNPETGRKALQAIRSTLGSKSPANAERADQNASDGGF